MNRELKSWFLDDRDIDDAEQLFAPTSMRSQFANPNVLAMHAYTPGEQPEGEGWVKLNTNENPYPPSPLVAEALRREIGHDGAALRLYPNPSSRPLREALARHHRVSTDWILAGNGSDDLLNLLMRVFAGPDRPAGMTTPSYSLYPVLAALQNAQLLEVPFDRSFTLDPLAVAASRANIFFLTSPNAPGGVGFPTEQIADLARIFPGILVVDEAYAPFATENAAALVAEFPRLVITRTFSKAYSLAGLRVGYALARPEIISLLDRARDSYNLDRLAQAAALAALQDQNYFHDTIARVLRTREKFLEKIRALGWFAHPSQANFVLVEPRNARGETGPAVATDLFAFLKNRRILVRHFAKHPLTHAALRVTIGTDADMAALAHALDLWLNPATPR
ncbi:MAG: histidinol-phosphate transaminase [Opitutales bacterium]